MNDRVEGLVPAISGSLTVLCVDDESNILNSLRRLLRPAGYRVLTASSGAEALAALETGAVDVVLSDMQMPEMNGARLLQQVKERAPEIVRILLTGHADLSSTIAAINDAGIYRYISKPWDDEALVNVVRDALELKLLKQERDQLQKLTQQQNADLCDLNATLESKVTQRTAELDEALAALNDTHEALKKSFFTSIKVFSNLIELREGAGAGHSRQIADTARCIATRMRLGDAATQDITIAGLLHGIGEFGLPDSLLRKPRVELTSDEQATLKRIPLKTQSALMALDQLSESGKIIRSYRERFDGYGYPDGLRGAQIPLGAQILSVAHDYEAGQEGMLTGNWLSKLEARDQIMIGRGNRYDPDVVDAFMVHLEACGVTLRAEQGLLISEIREGMTLARDLIAPDGMLLLAKHVVLDAARIEQLRRYESRDGKPMQLYVQESHDRRRLS